MNNRKKIFEFLFLMKNSDSYLFTSKSNHYQMLSYESIIKDGNKIICSVFKNFPNKPSITSHNFQIEDILKLWKNTKDIEFVRQSKIKITFLYIEKLFYRERQNKNISKSFL